MIKLTFQTILSPKYGIYLDHFFFDGFVFCLFLSLNLIWYGPVT
jgi:hypothetical protein